MQPPHAAPPMQPHSVTYPSKVIFKCPCHILMIDSDKKVVSKQPFASFTKVNSLQSWEYYAKIALILSLGMNYNIVINKCF